METNSHNESEHGGANSQTTGQDHNAALKRAEYSALLLHCGRLANLLSKP